MKTIARIKKDKMVQNIPFVREFKPEGVPFRDLFHIKLTIEEMEAIRLKHYSKLNQTACAKKMEISLFHGREAPGSEGCHSR